MKRFLLGISALLLTTAMGFAHPTVRPATYDGNHSPRLERASWWHHRNQRDKKHYRDHHKNRRDNRHERRDHHRDNRRDNYNYRPYRGY